MAIYHCSVKAVSRSAGRSSTAAAAYRAGCEITDGRTGEVHDYTKKRGVESADIVLPDGAPKWANDRSALWNAAETAERRKDACVAREFEVALPSELSASERRRLAVDFAKEMANREGCAVDVAIHAPGKEGDNRNHHAHILRTTRKVGPDGLTDKLDTEKAGRKRGDDLAAVRTRWAELVNERLQENGIEARVDHRSLKDQGIDREPTSHKGPAVTAMERRGVQTDVGQRIGIEVAERLANARAEGVQERELAHTSKSIIDLAGDLKAALVERDQQLQIKQRLENEQRINSSLERIGSNVQAAGRAGADADRALLASKQSLITATGHTRDIERGAQGAVQGAERRVAERDYGRVVEAAKRQFERVGNVLQQAGRNIDHVVRPIAAAAQHIAIYTVERERQAKERAQAARQALAATELSLRAQKTPVAPSRPSAAAVLANVATHLDQSNKSEPKARAVEAPAPATPAALLEQFKAKLEALAGRVVDLRDAAFTQISGTVIAVNERWAAMYIGRDTQLLDRQQWPVEEGRNYELRNGPTGPQIKSQPVTDRSVSTLEYVYGKQVGAQAKQWAERDKGQAVNRGPQLGR